MATEAYEIKKFKTGHPVVIGCEQNLRESSVNVISLFTICTKSEIHEWQFSPCFVILSEKRVNFSVILHEITEIMGNMYEFNWNLLHKSDLVKC